MRRFRGLLLCLLAAVLLSGCQYGGKAVSGDATPPAKTLAPSITIKVEETETTPEPSPSPTPLPEPPPPYAFPMVPAGLFRAQGLPENFSYPFHLSGNGQMFLFATSDNRVLKAQWDGADYTVQPVAENVLTGPGAGFYVNENETALYCLGSRQDEGAQAAPTVMMVSLENGARCNIDEYAGWKEQGYRLAGDFQYGNGRVLARLEEIKDGKAVLVDKWALVDIAARTYSVLDLTGFRQANLPGWQETVCLRLALTGPGRLLAVCAVRGPSPLPTGVTGDQRKTFACYAFEMDLSGHVSGGVLISEGDGAAGCSISEGNLFDASPDGRYLLYSASQTPTGIFVYDLAGNKEHVLLKDGAPSRVFAQWAAADALYYGTAKYPPADGIMLNQTGVSAVIGGS